MDKTKATMSQEAKRIWYRYYILRPFMMGIGWALSSLMVGAGVGLAVAIISAVRGAFG